MENGIFLKKYKEQALSQLKLVFPDKTDEFLLGVIEEQIKESVKDPKNKFQASMIDPKGVEIESSVEEILDYLESEKPVISGFGALYEQHSKGTRNILLDMVQMLLDTRKVYKKKKFENDNGVNPRLYNLYEKYQLTFKLLNNAFFGAAIQPQSIFFDPYFGPAIMYTGQIIITTAILAFESFNNNFYFNTIDDCLLFIDRIVKEDYTRTTNINIRKTKDELLKYLNSKFENRAYNINILKNVIDNLTDEQVQRVYYKNNFLEFILNDEPKQLLEYLIGKEFLDPNKPSAEIKDQLNDLWDLCKNYVMNNYIPLNRVEFAHNHNRSTVLVVDTDSNFLYNKPFTNIMRKEFPEKLKDYETDSNLKVSTVNISMFMLTKLITEVYFYMGGMLNVDEDRRPTINMKNEFFYDRLEMTPAKKHYAGILLAQEGKLFKEPRLDMKGLALRKTSLNKNVRDYFTDTLVNKILTPKEINLSEVYKDFLNMENSIRDSLEKGECTFVQPGKVNEIQSYTAPYTIQTVRGSLLWNALFPDNPIKPPIKINFVKLKPLNYQDFVNQLPEEVRKDVLKLYASCPGVNGTKGLSDYEVNIICIPKNLKKLPEFLIPLIDIETMVHDQIRPAMEIINPLGFKSVDILNSSYVTNVIEI